MRNLFLYFMIVVGCSVYGQIVSNLVPSTTNPVNISVGTKIDKAYNSITLTAGFTVVKGTGPGNNFYMAYLVPPTSYAELKRTLDDSYYTTIDNNVFFKYVEEYFVPSTNNKLKYQIYNSSRTAMVPQTATYDLVKTMGVNYLAINLAAITAMIATDETNSYYTLEVSNDNDEKWLLRFKYVPIK